MESNLTSNKSLLAWLDEKVELLKPSNILWIDGSKECCIRARTKR